MNKYKQVMIYPDDPFYCMGVEKRQNEKTGKVYKEKLARVIFEHRLVMARKLGRPLVKDELVHHVDGNSLNNDPSNLQIVSDKEHYKIESIVSLSKYAEKLRAELRKVEDALEKLM